MIKNKKIKKLIKNPKLFLLDSVKNKSKLVLPKEKVHGHHNYTVVSAVYGVEKYLEDYFKSLVSQTLDFKKHIHLVMVDDGSLDNSAQIIKKWQKKYPDNITYVKKENGGQASARNLGLDYVKTAWVTFIDPDDFLNSIYFETIDKFLSKNKNKTFSMISNNFIFYYEEKKQYSDTHPLKYRFSKIENIVKSSKMNGNIQMSVCTALFKNSIIKETSLKFNENIKPSFEDANFILKYLLYDNDSYIAFLKEPKYFYRKRESGGSTLDTAWENPKTFNELLQYGCIDLFKESILRIGFIPEEQQKSILYHLIWQFKIIVNNSNSISFLNEEQILKYKSLIYEIYSYIDIAQIEKFNLAGAWFYHKVGLLGMMKNHSLDYQIVYVEDYDDSKQQVLLRYFSYFDSSAICMIDNKEVFPSHSKIRRHDFLGDLFVNEYLLWVPIEESALLDVYVGNLNTRISFKGKHLHNGVDTNEIKQHFKSITIDETALPLHIKLKRKLYLSSIYSSKFKDAWLFIDRDNKADDNAEHLYQYIMNNHKNINIFFIIKKSSPDWNRLKKLGFNLISFASIEHEASLLHAKHILGSDAIKYVTDYLPKKYYKDLLTYKYTFLQHGVTKDDLSLWLNAKNIDCFVTTSKREYDSIASDNNAYKFTSKELILTGFPRHDKLLLNNHSNTKSILIMPTWRKYLDDIDKKNIKFEDTVYGKSWINIVQSKYLKELIEVKGYTVIFFPHPNVKKYLKQFNIPKYISILDEHKSIQSLFQSNDILITDYSSVAFEMAILKKQTIYYQFDHEDFFSGGHSYSKGYFDYENDGFGPVCYHQKEVEEEVENFIKTNGSKKYYDRIDNFFVFDDTNNCKRVYEAIENLDKPEDKIIDVDTMLALLDDAYNQKAWKTIESIVELLEENDKCSENEIFKLVESKYNLGKIDTALDLLKDIETTTQNSVQVARLKFELKKMQSLFNQLTDSEQNILVNEKQDLFSTLRFENIQKLFKDNKFKVLAVAFELTNIEDIQEESLSSFYYMWGRTLGLTERKREALSLLAQSLSYNIIKPNSSLWEYASTLYEVYDMQTVDSELILKSFKEQNYEVTNVDYQLIKNWFDKKHYKQVAVAFELINIEDIQEESLSSFYYMWAFVLKNTIRYKDALKIISKITIDKKHLLILQAELMIRVSNWEKSLELWEFIYSKYPSHDRIVVLKNIIYSLKNIPEDNDKFDFYKKELNSIYEFNLLDDKENIIDFLKIVNK